MLSDAADLHDGATLRAEVGIVGAGAAGLTLARALARRGVDVLLLESGGLEAELATQQLYDGPAVGLPYPVGASRLRFFGGSTNHWGGLCQTLEADDFAARPWVPYSGWPITKRDLDPYYADALAVLELPRLYEVADVERDPVGQPWLLGRDHPAFRPLVWLRSPPTRMGLTCREEVRASDRIRCVLHANVVKLVPDAAGAHVQRGEVRTLAGRRLTVEASRWVLAAGGIENARLLLASDTVVPGGLGNRHGLVGRFFMENPNQIAGDLVVAGVGRFQEEDLLARAGGELPGVWAQFFGLTTTPAVRRAHRLLGCALCGLPARMPERDPTAVAVRALVAREAGASPDAVRWFRIGVLAEQAPDPASRVVLSDERDALGQRRAALDLRLQPCDLRSIMKTLRLFAVALGRAQRGRIRVREVSDWNLIAGHHVGTTRMADDPRQGVTDRDGRVHGIANLWIAGSSVFPTAGWVNPTLTIVALALRLADHLVALRS